MEQVKKRVWLILAAFFLVLSCSCGPAAATRVAGQAALEGEQAGQPGLAKLTSTAVVLPVDPAWSTAAAVTQAAAVPAEAGDSGSRFYPTGISEPSLPSQTPALPAKSATPKPDTRKDPKYWPEWPLIPAVSARAKEIYALGQQLGNDPHSFTTVGDCQSEPDIFMGMYDGDHYNIGEGNEHLEETIRQFAGSFSRDSVTVQDGLSVASVLSPAWADPERCEQGETPLDCEIRLHRPVIAFVNLGTNWNGGDDVKHEKYMRQVIDVLVEHGVVPVISTKGDNVEGDHRLNRSIARVSYDYDLPLWNFWLAIRHLPGKGIDGTRPGGYLIPDAWGPRSFTGLQALDAVWRGLTR